MSTAGDGLSPDPGARAALDLLARVHGYPSGAAYAAEYPTVFGRVQGALTENEGSGPLATASARLGAVHGPAGSLGLARIGSVATDPAHRGRGLASTVMRRLHERLRSEGMAVSALWAERGGLYARMGYVPVGCCVLSPVTAPAVGFRQGFSVRPLGASPPPARGPSPLTLWRSDEETAALLTIPHMVALAGVRDGQVVAHAIMGKGADMTGIVHDFSGDDDDVLALMQALNAQSDNGALALLPLGHSLVDRLPQRVGRVAMAWLKVLDREALLSFASQHTGAEDLMGLPDTQLLQTLFGTPPDGPAPVAGRLPLYIWGLDSI